MVQPGDIIIVDGFNGVVALNPTKETLKHFEKKRLEYERFEETLTPLRDQPAETLDGHRVQLAANVELEQELEFIKMQGADGIGLYRTESLLLGKEVFPSEQEQYEQYRRIAESLYPKQVVVRTFDIGGDKFMAQTVRENNPFLGWRGIRMMLDKPQIFFGSTSCHPACKQFEKFAGHVSNGIEHQRSKACETARCTGKRRLACAENSLRRTLTSRRDD